MPTTPRHPIHIPYFVDRFRTADPELLRQTLNQVMSELHRYLRYLGDSSDQTMQNFDTLDAEILDLQFISVSVPPIGLGQSPYEVQPDDEVLLVDATDGAVTVLLPIAIDNQGRVITIKKIDSSANFVTVDGNGALLDSDPDFDLELEDEVIEVVGDGTAWWII